MLKLNYYLLNQNLNDNFTLLVALFYLYIFSLKIVIKYAHLEEY